MQPHLTSEKRNRHGFSIIELLLVFAMVAVIAGFAIVSRVRAKRSVNRANAAVEIANYLQKARLDSMRRSAKNINQMAQLKVFNRKFYSLAIDGDHDGYLDIPLVMSLSEQLEVEFNGPFPKTYIFDWQGQTVDSQNNLVVPPALSVGDSSGASAITFSEGKITVVPSAKLTPVR